MKRIYFTCILSIISVFSFAQNWQYVGTPLINQSVGYSTYLYFGDLELDSSGNVLIGYWQSQANTLFFAKWDGSAWAQLPSPGTVAVNYVDIEVHGNNYYMAYSGVKSGNMYVYVKKFDGSAWSQLGDSLLLGNSGSGGWFDFLLDNNEVPTLLGPVATTFAEKQMVQFTGGAWSTIVTFTGSAGTIFRENSAIYNAQNTLVVATQGTVSAQPFTVIHEMDGVMLTTLGDTLFGPSSAHKVRLDGAGVPYVAFNEAIKSEILAYKYNGSTWSFIADTTGAGIGTMLSAAVTSTGKVVFNTLTSDLDRSVYFYQNGSRYAIDSINLDHTILTVADLVVPTGSNEVYALVGELTAGYAQDFSVVKHTVTGVVGLPAVNAQNNTINIYPNPASGKFTVTVESMKGNGTLRVCNLSGQEVYFQPVTANRTTINLQAAGIYFVELTDEYGVENRGKLVIQP
jgi:hypothetical protein